MKSTLIVGRSEWTELGRRDNRQIIRGRAEILSAGLGIGWCARVVTGNGRIMCAVAATDGSPIIFDSQVAATEAGLAALAACADAANANGNLTRDPLDRLCYQPHD